MPKLALVRVCSSCGEVSSPQWTSCCPYCKFTDTRCAKCGGELRATAEVEMHLNTCSYATARLIAEPRKRVH
jgi:hypothetical protein